MSDSRQLIVLSGAAVDLWEEEFVRNVEWRDNIPVRGSIGVFFGVTQDIGNLFHETCGGNMDRFKQALLRCVQAESVLWVGSKLV